MADQGVDVTYSVDLVLCIDATGSMGTSIERVKDHALKFYDDLQGALAEKKKAVDALRLRIIAFRDYAVDGDQSMVMSDFFSLPDEKDGLARFVKGIDAMGGGDEPEHGLEALAYAIRSPWTAEGTKRRQVIVVWTDASSHPLGIHRTHKNYPGDIPADFDALTDLWDGQTSPMQGAAKRLVLFAPDAASWTDISTYWEQAVHFPSHAGAGLSDIDYGSILDTIANSI